MLANGLSLPLRKEGSLMEAYCMKCRAKREMKDAKKITMKNGKPATQGVCPKCGTKMFRIGKS
jgi:NAD-dependent SIR2 family protein deacetylase